MKRKVTSISAVVLVLVLLLTLALSCGEKEEPAPFSMEVIPELMEDAIAGQSCVFLVVVADEGQGSGAGEAVNISATGPGSAVTVDPQAITPGQVAEVTVVPLEAGTGGTLTVTIRGEREGLNQTETVTIDVKGEGGEDGLGPFAAEMRDKFIPWLAANHPEFGITSETEWTETIVRPNIVVVMYYLFFSEDWEMGVSWHVTISPHDWTRIYLRHRTTEARPSYAFEISSWSAEQEEPHAIDPPESVWR